MAPVILLTFTKTKYIMYNNVLNDNPVLFIEVHVPSQESERSCFYHFPIGYWNRSDCVVFVFINKKRLLFILDIQLKPLPVL